MTALAPAGHPAARPPGGVVALASPVPVPGVPPGTLLPGLAVAGAGHDRGQITRITRLAHAVPGKPDGETDTRPLRPLWQQPAPRRQPRTATTP